MGLSASQARFLQLTARRSDLEYEAQQINFQRLQLSNKLADASSKYQDATSNRKLVFSFNQGDGIQKVDLSYTNYKNYMNQQEVTHSQEKYYLVSSSGRKLVVQSEAERDKMIKDTTEEILVSEILAAKAAIEKEKELGKDGISAGAEVTYDIEETVSSDESGETTTISKLTITQRMRELANIDLTSYESRVEYNEETGEEIEYYVDKKYTEKDFIIDENLDDVDFFQNAIKNGTYYFAQYKEDSETHEDILHTLAWETMGANAISEEFDKEDDPAAEAEYDRLQKDIQSKDKKLELKLDQIETNREAIQTELESVEKVVDDNIESTFNKFS